MFYDESRPTLDWTRAGWTTTAEGAVRILIPLNVRPRALEILRDRMKDSLVSERDQWESDVDFDLSASVEEFAAPGKASESVLVLSTSTHGSRDPQSASRCSADTVRRVVENAVYRAVKREATLVRADRLEELVLGLREPKAA